MPVTKIDYQHESGGPIHTHYILNSHNWEMEDIEKAGKEWAIGNYHKYQGNHIDGHGGFTLVFTTLSRRDDSELDRIETSLYKRIEYLKKQLEIVQEEYKHKSTNIDVERSVPLEIITQPNTIYY